MDNGYENRRTEGSTRLRLTLCFTKVARKYRIKNDGDDDLAHSRIFAFPTARLG